MVKARAQVSQQREWDYLDVMTAALACLDDDRLYADSERWNAAWQEIATSDVAGELLPELYFDSRGPYQGSSDQVEALIRTLSRASILSLGNPRYMFFTMDPQAKQAIRAANDELIRDHATEFDAMKKVLTKKLVVH